MGSKTKKYRNLSAPLGYVKKTPDLLIKENKDGENYIRSLISLIISTDICNEEDVSVYKVFTINSSSEDDEIVEVPVEAKKIEVVNIIEDEKLKSKKDIHITIKKEANSPSPQATAETSEGLEQISKQSVSPGHKKIPVKSDIDCLKDENVVQDKKEKKHDQDSNKKFHKKRVKEQRPSFNSDICSSERSKHKKLDDSDNDSHSRRQHKKQERIDSDGDSYSKNQFKKSKSIDSDSGSNGRSQCKKQENYDSDGDSHRSHHINKENYDDDFYSRSRYKMQESFYDEDSQHRSLNKKRDIYDNDSDSYSRSRRKERRSISSGSRSSSERRDYKGYIGKDNDNAYKKDRGRHIPSPNSQGRYHSKEYEETLQNVSQEADPEQLYGSYDCKICHTTMNNYTTYVSHINGKKHKKALKLLQNSAQRNIDQNVAESAAEPSTSSQNDSKYPKAPPKYVRVKLNCTAKVQAELDKNTKIPLPGLDKVIEIQTFTETSYYCSMCDCHCSINCILPHLNGFKHQMSCLKYYRNDLYQKWSYKQKYQIVDSVTGILRDEEKKNGRGKIKVEKDQKETDDPNEIQVEALRDPARPSTSAGARPELYAMFQHNSVPDPTKSGYFCKVCNSHSNSEVMWQSHIVGKRHMTNVKKHPGTAPSKSKYIPAPNNVRPILYSILERENTSHSPVVGLSQIREIQKPDINAVSFNCFLCSACVASLEVVKHILSTKHREKYLASIKHPELETLRNCQISELSRSSIIEEICFRVEAEKGRGEPEIYYDKNAVLG